MKSPIKVAITGAAGQIGYALVFRVASGAMFGPDQPIALHLIEIPNALVRASAERKVKRQKPFTQQEIVAEAVTQWLRKNGFLD